MQRNAPAHKKPIRRADDLVPFVGGCMDCRYRTGDSPGLWRCGALGGKYTETVRMRGEPCPHWQQRPKTADLRAALPAISFWMVIASLIVVAAAAISRCDDPGPDLRYRGCLDEGHGPAACAPLLKGEQS